MEKEVAPSVRPMGYQGGDDSKGQENTFLNGSKSGLNGGKNDGIISYMEITNEWTKEHDKKGSVTEKKSYIVNGIVYIVDGVHVILKPSDQERKVAEILSSKYGRMVELVPQMMYPQGIQTPDYMIDGERFDLKTPTGSGKNLFYNVVAKKREQSSNFIFDVTNCPLSDDEIDRQVKALYYSRHTRFVDKIVIMKDEEILKIYKR